MKAIHLFPVLLVAMACSPAVTPEPVVVRETVDGRMILQAGADSSDFTRCWPINGKQDCIALRFVGAGGTSYASVERRILPTFPETAVPFKHTENLVGFSCTILWSGTPSQTSRVNISARISRGGTVLASSLSQAGSPMERDFVDQWETENRIDLVSKYVNCNEIARLIEQGSLETIGTAMLKYPTVIGDLPDPPLLPTLENLEASLTRRIPDS